MPNKIKTFAWLASRNILLTKANLCHQKVCHQKVFDNRFVKPVVWKLKVVDT